ncbi:LexA repressor [Lachnospiraceae bacterium]|jgi:SOS-response transcriptional repressors (RecA-mediated autopeptidases)|nr:LexA repressor [Lachnospiraceae bacterium]
MEKEIEQTQITTQEMVYNFLIEFIKKNGYPPSLREICTGTHLSSTSSVHNHLLALENEEKIKMKPNSPRALKVIEFQFVKMEGVLNGKINKN